MSRLFESFEYLDRGWDVRALEGQSLRRVFLWLLVFAMLMGADLAIVCFTAVRFGQLNWVEILNIVTIGLLGFRYGRAFYRRLQ
jgi:hypothetical protein